MQAIMHSHSNGYFILASCHCADEACDSKNEADVKSVDKWLMYRMVVGYKVINQGRCFSLKDLKDEYLSDG